MPSQNMLAAAKPTAPFIALMMLSGNFFIPQYRAASERSPRARPSTIGVGDDMTKLRMTRYTALSTLWQFAWGRQGLISIIGERCQ